MIPLFLLAAAVPIASLPGGDAARFNACVALIRTDPDKAIAEGDAWRVRGNSLPARHCLGLAYAAAGRWAPAAVTFEQAARDAESQGDGRAATLWSQAGNAALAGDDPARARDHLDHALALPTLADPLRGEALLDRARADVASNDMKQARADLDAGLKLVPQDPFAWLLSATLARRQGDLPRAEKDIGEAARIAPDSAEVALEAGNIALLRGVPDAATLAWTRAAQLAPNDPAGRAAAEALAGGR